MSGARGGPVKLRPSKARTVVLAADVLAGLRATLHSGADYSAEQILDLAVQEFAVRLDVGHWFKLAARGDAQAMATLEEAAGLRRPFSFVPEGQS
jgi:hypothetical protein